MAQKTTKTKRLTSAKLWPQNVTPMRSLLMLSVLLNLAVLIVLIMMYQGNALNSQIIKAGTKAYCSQDYRAELNYEQQVTVDYTCHHGDAKQYFVDGLNAYRATKSLPALED